VPVITDLSPPLTSEIEAFPSDERIMPSMLEQTHIDQPRIVLPARTMPDPNIFDAKLAAMHVNVVDWLYEQDVSFVRIDTPSIDPANSKTLDAHARFQSHLATSIE
jgi:arylformamidase